MKKIKFILAVFRLAAIFYACKSSSSNEQGNQADDSNNKIEKISLWDLTKQYKNDAGSALSNYLNKTIEIEGLIIGNELTSDGDTILHLWGYSENKGKLSIMDGWNLYRVKSTCILSSPDMYDKLKLLPNEWLSVKQAVGAQVVTVQGDVVNMTLSNESQMNGMVHYDLYKTELKNCRIVSIKELSQNLSSNQSDGNSDSIDSTQYYKNHPKN